MARKSKKNHILEALSDINIYDAAHHRSKKSLNAITTIVNQEFDDAWDEKDFDGDFTTQINEDGSISYVIKPSKEEVVRKKSQLVNDEPQGNDYHSDLWYLISEYIRPEDVGTFASICKTSYEVVKSAKFWFHLYRRYYHPVANIPTALEPDRLIRKYGLRKNVIRALYFTYQPFVQRLHRHTLNFDKRFDLINRYQCIQFGYILEEAEYICTFKMKPVKLKREKTAEEKPKSLLEILDNIQINSDDQCRVLQGTCLHLDPVPNIIGMVLKSYSLTQCFQLREPLPKHRHYRLQLEFVPMLNFLSKSRETAAGSSTVILDPIFNLSILDWWHPHYPTSFGMEELKNFNQDKLL